MMLRRHFSDAINKPPWRVGKDRSEACSRCKSQKILGHSYKLCSSNRSATTARTRIILFMGFSFPAPHVENGNAMEMQWI